MNEAVLTTARFAEGAQRATRRRMHGAPLTLHNSLTRNMQRFEPIDPAKGVRVYSCGPTVYT